MSDPMQDYFYTVADRLTAALRGAEVLTLRFEGETSDFVRLNHNRVRQAGTVTQSAIALDLIEGRRHAQGTCTVGGDAETDMIALHALLADLRAQRAFLPEDPYLHYATEVLDSEHRQAHAPPAGAEAVAAIMRAAEGLDLVGIWAGGEQYAGFANSLGQRNWHSGASFNFDWSCYHARDKAVKCSYAGLEWDPAQLARKMDAARAELEVMARPARTLAPGEYRAYLAPAALQDILAMMSWGGFGLKSHRTAQTPLLKMVRAGAQLSEAVTLVEEHGRGTSPPFTPEGFALPARVGLIERGRYGECLVGARSAREYGVAVNSAEEAPQSLDMAPGLLARDDVLAALDTGLLINHLWYCNFSDRNDCRITGMTRFACFWVEGGRIQAPVDVMRFDDSVYRMLGTRLAGLTREREFLLDPGTYGRRSRASCRLPGALLEGLRFTL